MHRYVHALHPSISPSIHTVTYYRRMHQNSRQRHSINLLGDRCAILLTTSPPPDVLHQRDTASLGAVPLHIQLLRWLCPGVTWGTWRRSQWGCLMLGGWVYKPYRTGKSSLEDRFYWNFEPWSSGLNAPAWYGLRSFSRWIGWSSMLMACLKKFLRFYQKKWSAVANSELGTLCEKGVGTNHYWLDNITSDPTVGSLIWATFLGPLGSLYNLSQTPLQSYSNHF